VGLRARDLVVSRPGLVPYKDALDLQTRLHEQRSNSNIADILVLLEHPHVFTIGRRGSREDVLWDDEVLKARAVEVVEADRGGQVTYHGPGQIVGYPIVDLGPGADLVAYVRKLEDVLIATLARFGLLGEKDEGNTGVWIGNSKVAAIGVRVTRGVTKHGFALNVCADLSYFAGIIPCGITDKGVTSMALHMDSKPPIDDVYEALEQEFVDVFGYTRALEPVA
jgi:lipoyl(octanoyl) transferase